MVTFANLGSVCLPRLKLVGLRVRKIWRIQCVSAVYLLEQFPSYSNHNCIKSSFLRTLGFIFCLPWGRPCGNHAKRCMNEKKFSACQTPRSMYPYIFNSFPVIRTASAKNRSFHVPQPTFLFPLETPLQLSPNMFHGWKDNSFNACQTPRSMYLSILNTFRVIRCLSQCISPIIAIFLPHFGFPWGRPWGNYGKCCMDGMRI